MPLRPWRDLIAPHTDVLNGTYQEAEFAADLSKVAAGTATAEYQDPRLFFERTYITEGMRLLLDSLVRRLAGNGGDPVIQLKTAFGGGKTHTMLAVYHVAKSAIPASEMMGIPQILDKAGVSTLPKANVAILDGNAFSASQPRKHGNVTTNTLWGELAWQLGGEAAYEMLAQADQDGTSPGKEVLAAIFTKYSPCVILMDETVAYIRQFEESKSYKGGTFESNLSFMQALTEAISQVPTTILLASLPESDLEVGGAWGKHTLNCIEKIFGRMEAIWKPVATLEGFEIVRRRLFSTVSDTNARDEVCRAFAELYTQNKGQFPTETVESSYLDRLKGSYPIHPEIFERLYEDWSTLEKFQRTRGVLRLMAMVIHRLWSDGNHDYLIMPGSLPLNAPQVHNELTRYLPNGWDPVIERDIDGPNAIPTRMDDQNSLIGSLQGYRRVARAIFLGSAPTVAAQKVRGISAQRVHLGCAQPSQQLGRFDDALKHLNDKLHYLYSGNERYWFDTKPNLRREMEERKERYKLDDHLTPEIQTRLRNLFRGNKFGGIHVFTPHEDIPDDHAVRLVVLSPLKRHKAKQQKSPAIEEATTINTTRGQQPRQFQNRLVFLAADEDSMARIWDQAKTYLAWKSICDDTSLNLDRFQTQEAKKNCDDADKRLGGMLAEAWKWLLAPAQEAKPGGGVTELFWEEKNVATSSQNPVDAIFKVLVDNELLIPKWAPIHLKNMLQTWFWKEGRDETPVMDFWKASCSYPYLPRLTESSVLQETISAGVITTDYFAYASGKEGDKYLGLLFGKTGSIYIDQSSLLIHPVAVQSYLAAQATATPGETGGAGVVSGSSGTGWTSGVEATGAATTGTAGTSTGSTGAASTTAPKRFHGSVNLNPITLGLDAAKIAEEIVQHFTSQVGTSVNITLEVEAYAPDGIKDNVRRAIQENARTLRFTIAEFEEE
jgi:predicted AAA+ superfamily ATPase